jgi:TPP-dependent pyruvate/acetoin dehydrogenase alpha subunit/pyruvate/2-oxoglutarate/acetoin dehydrogenase E1 component
MSALLKAHRKLPFHANFNKQVVKCYFSTSWWWEPFRSTHQDKIEALPETKAVHALLEFFKTNSTRNTISQEKVERPKSQDYKHLLNKEDYLLSLDAAMVVFSLHVHARIASMVGHGYYTIGPCGEELLSSAGVALQPSDASALHYRHTGMSVARQLGGGTTSLHDILLSRARGYTVSKYDPVTGGVHCSIGGGPNEYLVTSTLSSQCPTAVGRALGYSLVRQHEQSQAGDEITTKKTKKGQERPISFCTIGDGSLHNHHFLSSFTLARHAKHLGVKCPIVFGISNNGLSISYETKNYIDTVFSMEDPLMPVFRADGQDMLSVYDQTKQACDYARSHQSPCVVLYENLVRRFGHAATDRQTAYLSPEQIEAMADTCVLQQAMAQAVHVLGYTTYAELQTRWEEIHLVLANQAFAQAINEPKVTLEEMMERVAPPLAVLNRNNEADWIQEKPELNSTTSNTTTGGEKPQVLRKHMTRVFQELMTDDSSIVYLGEDVRHGGYYLVTEGLAKQFPSRVLDFPPDETTLLGAALGFAQLGLTPIVEIPYAKYLDCGADLFYEIGIQHWLGSQHTNGMIIRLQGFDRGVFGGNFHTHNSLPHIPPGVDVVCFSNGTDYVNGMRHAVRQAKTGRVVMVVDCTYLLNLRHVFDKDRAWEFPFPVAEDENDLLGFDTVHRYSVKDTDTTTKADIAVVSYGNGIVTSLQARQGLVERDLLSGPSQLDVIDCPYLSDVPPGLEAILKDYNHVVFADLCKEGPGSNVFSSMIISLSQRNALPVNWAFVGAPRTYSPLGSTVTFLNKDTIEEAVAKLVGERQEKA